MATKYFWPLVIAVTALVEEALRTGLVPPSYVPLVGAASTLLGFLVQKHKAG